MKFNQEVFAMNNKTQKQKSDIINEIATLILFDDIDSAKKVLLQDYPHNNVEIQKRSYSISEKMEQFIEDGFIDRYSGAKLVNPGILKVISQYFPNDFPYQSHWKMAQTHIAYWELFPTIDHINPISSGGFDTKENRITTSMKNNSIKSNYRLEEIGWSIYPKGDLKEWDGLTSLFINIAEKNKELLNDNYIKNWYNISKKNIKTKI